jgi:hypothetical protein
MSDQCKRCICRGDFKACQSVECHQHESWYAKQMAARVKELEEELDIAVEVIEDSGIDYDEATEHLRKSE